MAAAAAAPASGIGELLAAKQLGEDQQAVLDSVKEYYGEVGGCWRGWAGTAGCTTPQVVLLVCCCLQTLFPHAHAALRICALPPWRLRPAAA